MSAVPQIQAVYSGLRNIAQSAAARINSSSSSTGAGSSEMRSFGVVNDAWAAVIATITAVSASSSAETRFELSGITRHQTKTSHFDDTTLVYHPGI